LKQLNDNVISLTEDISYIPGTVNPISSDVVFIKCKNSTFIFDTGLTKESALAINKIEGIKNIVISHFHGDHILNLRRVKYDNLYLSSHTKKYTFKGSVISEKTELAPGLFVLPLPSSHAKGSLILTYGDYAFMGDGTYCTYKKFHHVYNKNLLCDMILAMKNLNVKYFCLSHDKNFVQKKEDVIKIYEDIYARKVDDNSYINVDDFFKADGSVNDKGFGL
jgi:glyoxylase-like metal-dependent hydrolase (beta-lactamase superfamily II)